MLYRRDRSWEPDGAAKAFRDNTNPSALEDWPAFRTHLEELTAAPAPCLPTAPDAVVVAVRLDAVVVGHASAPSFFFSVRVVCAAIHTANATIPPMPTSQAIMPSLTGPRLPSVNPP